MRRLFTRIIAASLALMMLSTYLLVAPSEADAAHHTSYSTVTVIKNQGDCYAMQGCDSDENYIYCTKVNTETETSCAIARVNKDTGDTVFLTNSATGTYYFSQLAHANDLDVVDINGTKTIFVATGTAGMGPYSLVRFVLSGTTLTEVAHYDMQYNGGSQRIAGAQVMSIEGDNINMLFLWSQYVYKATIGVSQKTGKVTMEHVCTLDYTDITMNGTKYDLSGYVKQGFEYYDGKLYVPLTGQPDYDVSTVTAWDIIGASGTIKNNPNFSVRIADTTFVDLFEMESVTICPADGKMYFTTNRRKTSSDGNWDGVHSINSFVYNPALGDDTATGNYRWNITGGTIYSSNQEGMEYNYPLVNRGTISGTALSSAQIHLDRTVTLNHSDPWVIQWKSSNVKNAMLMSTTRVSGYAGNMYLYVRADGLVSLGTASGGYQNYGINVTNHGYSVADSHTYTLENRINADGSNMVYLKVDGKELGAMNNHYVGGTSQNTTNNWVSGKDFKFSYLGTIAHPINGTYTNIRVWGKGYPGRQDEPNTLRWETSGNALSPITEYDHTAVSVTKLHGTVSGTTYTGYQGKPAQNITLLHTRPWSIEWTGNPSGMLLATMPNSRVEMASYLYRSGIVAFGRWNGTDFANYGVKLSDYGIDGSAVHTYRLTNRINADGSNMVYLYVDGTEIAPMDTYFLSSTQQSTGDTWISGKDFSFDYFGTYQFPVAGTLNSIRVWEDGIPSEQPASSYYWTPGTNVMTPSTTSPYIDNPTTILGGSNSGTTMNNAWYRMDKSVVLLHDRSWSVQWESDGNWHGSSTGAFLLSASQNTNELNAPYLYRRSNSDLIALGVRLDGAHQNYGVSLSDHGIDGTAKHTFLLQNRVNADGSNMVYLYVDGKEIAPMNTYFNGGTNSGTTDNWVSGKDFVFSYMGTPRFPIGGCTLSYMQINEGCTHSYGSWTVTEEATCTAAGSQTRSCTLCGVTQTESIPATDHSYQSTVTAPTCTADGYTTYTCTVCGDTYEGNAVAAAGHSYRTTVVAPTCISGGYTSRYCTVCGDSYQSNSVPANGHSYQNTVTAPTCTTGGYTTYRCSICGDSYQGDTTAANGHSYQSTVTAPTCTAGGYTTHRCSACGYSYQGTFTNATGHSYENGSCAVCGEADPNYVAPFTITLKYPTVSFEDEIVMNVYFTADSLDNVMELGLLTYSEKVSTWSIDNAEHVTPGYIYNASTGYLGVKTQGIPAKCLGDMIYFSVYAELTDGSYVYSSLVGYNPKTYAYNQLSTGSAEMKALVVAMLNYGAAAQTYFDYKTDTLVNADLTATQKALVSDYSSSMMTAVTLPDSAKLGTMVNNGGYTRRYPTISFEGAFCINYYFLPSVTPSGDITMYLWNQQDFNDATSLSKSNATQAITMELTESGEYLAVAEGIAAKDLDKGIYVSFCYSDGTTDYCSGVIGYSIGTYCVSQANKTGTLADLAAATAVYGYYAKQMFYEKA